LLQSHQRPIRQHTSGELLARNTLWNLLGLLSPVIAGAIAVPVLIRTIGTSRFGVLSIAWIVSGYLSLFDLGLGRALTKLAAEKIGSRDETAIVPITWTSLLLLLFLGILGGVIACAISPLLVYKALKVPAELQSETLRAFLLLAASIPLMTATSGLRGLLEALQRFRVLNLIRIPMSVFSLAGPLLVLPFSRSLVSLFAVLVAGRFIGCLVHLIACFQAVPALRRNFVLDGHLMAALFKLGGWMTATNLLGPAVIYADRFIIGGLLSLSAVAFYTAPFDMLIRVGLIPGALIGVLFPAFAATFKQEPARASMLLARGVKYIFMAIFPIILVVVTLSSEILRIWLGPAFAQNSARALQWLGCGIFLNCLALVPFTFIQSAGRPDVTAKMALVEFPFYWVAVWLMTAHYGINGTALAWAGRAACELGFLSFFAMRLLPQAPSFPRRLVVISGGGLMMLYLSSLLHGGWTKALFLIIALLAFALASWRWGLSPPERSLFARIGSTNATGATG
jgi:O-antigen/teichoic acid export membrane protein